MMKRISKKDNTVQWYSYTFQCYNCLAVHHGEIQTDNQMLEIECNSLIERPYDLFSMLGKPQVCGRLNHMKGRRIKRGKK